MHRQIATIINGRLKLRIRHSLNGYSLLVKQLYAMIVFSFGGMNGWIIF